MKNVLILFILFVGVQQIKAQDTEDVFSKSMISTQSNHIIDVGLISAGYTYEHAIGEHYTIGGGVGIAGLIGYASSSFFDEHWYYSFHPYVSIEPRYYYNLQKRLQKGKNVNGNAGSFFAVQCNYIFKAIKKHNVLETSAYTVSPYWGLRRIWWNHLLFEFKAGLAFGFNNYNDSNFGVQLGVKFGYKF
ncbi:MAG: hypothetical protein LBS69_02255 [Prevotellaceae bacterium]|nr:hypothetical protein [Prevotellaceae bacterium]